MAKAKEIKRISDLVPDDNNYNKGTEFGASLIEKSVRKLGAGRSVLADKNGNIIAGNKATEGIINAGFKDEDIIVVPTDGTKLVVVQRTDLDLNTKRGRELALADNATSAANLAWDHDALAKDWTTAETEEWGVYLDTVESFSNKNKEVDTDSFEDKMELKLIFNPDDFFKVKAQLSKIAANPAQAVGILLCNE